MPTEETARLAKLEARMEGHEALCTERWREIRDSLASVRTAQTTNHAAQQASSKEQALHLREIETTLISVKGGWKVIVGTASVSGVVIGIAVQVLPWIFRVLR